MQSETEKELTAHQVRLLKSLQAMVQKVLKTENEEEYFESSVELIRMSAALIKLANYPQQMKQSSQIPYGEQALEFALDSLQDFISHEKVITYDN